MNYSTAVPLASSSAAATPSTTSVFESHPVPRFVPKAVSQGTPKRPFFDDHRIKDKFTSPELRTSSDAMFEPAHSDMNFGAAGSTGHASEADSRRFSIDSLSRHSMTTTASMPQFNRFNTISENEFEEPDINRKSLELEMTGNLQRVSILQTRNQRAPPHLKSSYALEMDLPASELSHQQASSSSVLKENRPPLSSSKTNLNVTTTLNNTTANSKRRHDDSRATDSPPRKTSSHMVGIFRFSI